MEEIRRYILSVVAAAVFCAVIRMLVDQKSTSGAVVKLITGLLLTVTVIAPVANIKFTDISEYIENYSLSAEAAVQTGTEYAAEKSAVIIKQRTEAYILDKAQVLGADIHAEVILSEESMQKPSSVILTGDVSPYAKQRLMAVIAQDLGISEDNQIWK